MSQVFDIANSYVEAHADLDPIEATFSGIAGRDDRLTDVSPAGIEARAALDRQILSQLAAAAIESDDDRLARDFMTNRLETSLASHEAGDPWSMLSTLASPHVGLFSVLNQMPLDTEEHWLAVFSRLEQTPWYLDGFRATLNKGIELKRPASKRLALECAKQARTWSGEGQPQSFFLSLIEGYEGLLSARLREVAEAAAAAYRDLAVYLEEVYAPQAASEDGVGQDMYQRFSREWNGCELDLHDTYDWGWQELHRIHGEMQTTAERIKPGATPEEAMELLNTDPARSIEGEAAYQTWLQELHDEVIRDFDGTHFDIPDRIKPIEAKIPPPGGALAPHYVPPSEDFIRPGRTWWPIGTATTFPKWDKVTTAYHEGVPGHHLQLGGALCVGDRLSRFQKVSFISGHGEGWALYSERLMGELGYFENPDYYMGMLSGQALRAVRVIIDIGMHLRLAIPQDEEFHPGEAWNHDLALEFLIQHTGMSREFMASEVVRYLGLPGQAISYKVGEREWLKARENVKQKLGAAFDLKRFHTVAIELGPLPLAMLGPEIERALVPGVAN